uniref:Uncharacterized protein n=1 Tax=Glypta fumiferanae TaxID=389681 RepID=A0A0F6Q728_9HYME|nr:hypothetical protein [Glypta fumiferanae]
MNYDSDEQVHIRNELKMCKIDCWKCKFVSVHVCSGSSKTAREIDLRQIRYDFEKPFKCKECNFALEHRECEKFRFKKNSVIEFRCERCNFFCNHTCCSAYDQHEVDSEVIDNEENPGWYLRIVCGNTMSSFKHTCGMKQTMWADKFTRQKSSNQSPSESSSVRRDRLVERYGASSSCNSFRCQRNRNNNAEHHRRRSNIGQTSRTQNEHSHRHNHRHNNRGSNNNYCGRRDSWKDCMQHRRRIRRQNNPVGSSHHVQHVHCCCSRLSSSSSIVPHRARRN